VSAVIRNLFEQDLQYTQRRVKELNVEALPLEQKIRSLITIGIEVYRSQTELRGKLQNIQMYLTDADYMRTTMKSYEDLLARLLPSQGSRNMNLVSYVAV